MIPLLGSIVGIYTFTRLLAIATEDDRPTFLRGFAAFAAVITIPLCLLLFFFRIPTTP